MTNNPIDHQNMIWIPGGLYHYHATHRFREGGFILFDEGPRDVTMNGFFIDRYEVTNADYKNFLDATGYRPSEAHNFLRHWENGFPVKKADHPVVWVSLEDARAYATWAGKRLPTDIEWQRAAQGDDGRRWPWGNEFDPDKCNSDTPGTTPVDAFPLNTSPFGVRDLVGNVWEWIDVVCSDGWHNWCFLRGGSYYNAKGSMWYTEGGAQPVFHHLKFLLLNPSIDRCGTIGFRCIWNEFPTVINPYVLRS
jgi:formylglycine-generating enzyme required for sulfatase activity